MERERFSGLNAVRFVRRNAHYTARQGVFWNYFSWLIGDVISLKSDLHFDHFLPMLCFFCRQAFFFGNHHLLLLCAFAGVHFYRIQKTLRESSSLYPYDLGRAELCVSREQRKHQTS